MSLMSLQGYIRIGLRQPDGRPGQLFWAGNVPEATLEISEETTEVKESYTGQRVTLDRLGTGKGATFTGNFHEWSLKNLALGLYSAPITTAAGAVADEAFPTGLLAGDQIRLDHPYASDLVITDSAGVPATVPPANYRLTGHNDAIVELLNVGAFVQPFHAAYDFESYVSLDVFTQPAPERYVIFDGINTVNNEPVLVDLYRVRFAPFKNLSLLHAEHGVLPFEAAPLYDPLNANPDGTGGFYRMVKKPEV